jgi:hypothetical protein
VGRHGGWQREQVIERSGLLQPDGDLRGRLLDENADKAGQTVNLVTVSGTVSVMRKMVIPAMM